MMLRIMFIAEILSTIICLHCIYGRKFRLNVQTVGVTLIVLIILEVVNRFQLSGILSVFGYVILFLYCKFEFKSSMVETLISFVLSMIILTATQFGFMFLTNGILENNVEVRNVLSNIMTLAAFSTVIPACKLHRIQKGICEKKNAFMIILLGFMSMIVLLILVQGKVIYGVHMQYFVLVAPAIFLLLYLIIKWYKAQTEAERSKDEIRKLGSNVKIYEELLTNVRLRQHEFKNHMTAIFSARYTHETYDTLVKAQEEYCNQLLNENKYNDLLLLGNNVLVGYLYGKFQEAENDGIQVKYKINAWIDEVQIPIYYIIEMLGILFDNAVEALKKSAEKTIHFEVREIDGEYEFSLMNPFRHVQYDEITGWFKLDKSEKGMGRGVGLYHLKGLCDEWKCDLGCRNIEIEQKNWIKFTIKMRKADSN